MSLHGSLPSGDVQLGLDDDAAGIVGRSLEVPPAIRRKVATVAASLRAAETAPRPLRRPTSLSGATQPGGLVAERA